MSFMAKGISLLFFLIFCYSLQASTESKGIFAGSHYSDKPFFILKDQGTRWDPEDTTYWKEDFSRELENINRFIDRVTQSTNFETLNGISNKRLAEVILGTSLCLKFDPYLFTGIFKVETHFNRRRTNRSSGVIGLGQHTGIGIEEVHDQLGNRGISFAPERNISFFMKAKQCQSRLIESRFTMPFRSGMISKGSTVSGIRDRINRVRVKNWLAENVLADIFYAGVLFKIKLISFYKENQSFIDTYQKAVESYNGEVGHMRIYRERVFRQVSQIDPSVANAYSIKGLH